MWTKDRWMPGEAAVTGSLVRSRWSSSGAVWLVVDTYDDKWGRPAANLRSTKSNRIDTRRLRDLIVVGDSR